MAKQELLSTIRDRNLTLSKKGKSRILDEFIAVTGHHRKHGIRLLGQSDHAGEKLPMIKGRRIYDEAVREAVIVIWEAADRICGKRLKAATPRLVGSSGGVHGVAWSSGFGPRGAATAAGRQRSHPGPAAETHSSHGRQPTKTEATTVDGKTNSGADLQRLGPAPAGVSGD